MVLKEVRKSRCGYPFSVNARLTNQCGQPRAGANEVKDQKIIPSMRTVIADDEHLARQKLRVFLDAELGVQVVAECRDGKQAIAAVESCQPDLLLLDIRMPDLDGFQILERIPADRMPVVVFTSAHDQYAIRAFEANALDYLLKPFEQQRLHRAVEKARAELLKSHDRNIAGRVLRDLLAQTKTAPKSADQRFMIKAGGRLVFLDFDEIDWIEAAANYVKLNVGSASYLLREGIGRISERLDPGSFIRVHRSTIVNVRKIKELQPCDSGEFIAILRNGKELSCSRGCRPQLQRLIENKSLTV
jgi:two-component system, LytTR family, response regulator